MQLTIAARHGAVPDRVRRNTESQLQRLERFDHRPVRAQILFDSQRGNKKVEAHVVIAGAGQFIARATASNFQTALNVMLDRLIRQIKRSRERTRDHHPPRQRSQLIPESAPADGSDSP